MKNATYLTLLLSLFALSTQAQVDILEYQLTFYINDSTDQIQGQATIQYSTEQAFNLDLYQSINDTGMVVDSVFLGYDKTPTSFTHSGELLSIKDIEQHDQVTITYHGIPKDGLIISKNIYGNRTFFGDNWPNRAHHWFPCIDHPSEKAAVRFTVYAPNHYQVIANGQWIETSNLPNNYTVTKYATAIPLPTKVMVFGAASFAHQELGASLGFPISSWVYPENSEQGFYDYALAPKITDYFMDRIAPYPYEKLANVQSTTRYGGMENAGCIFYHEHSVDGERSSESLMAHELAHQWFGNSASEKDWPHLWLSEGFATYLTDLYMRDTHGTTAFNGRLKLERNKVIQFNKQWNQPVVDTVTQDLPKLLNPNSYQKGAWFLHMLRIDLGEDTFWRVLRQYYQTYQLSNANTDDFKAVAEEISGKDLTTFFQQWLYNTEIPTLYTEVSKTKKGYKIEVFQDLEFDFIVEIGVTFANGEEKIYPVNMNSKKGDFTIETDRDIMKIKIDPNTLLLFKSNQE